MAAVGKFRTALSRRKSWHAPLGCAHSFHVIRGARDSSAPPAYIEAMQEAGRLFVMRRIEGPVVTLDLLCFRETPEYRAALARSTPKAASTYSSSLVGKVSISACRIPK